MYDVTMTLCALSIKMYTRINIMCLQVSKPFRVPEQPDKIVFKWLLVEI